MTPVQKVVQLLENMKLKGTTEMQEEQVQYTKYKQFCEMTLAEKKAAIGEAADKIETLEADIEKADAEAERLTKEMSEHTADVEAATAEKEKATSVRKKGREDFQLTLKDYSESIDAIGRALKALKEEDKKTALLQLASAKLVPEEARLELLDAQGPAPKTYEFQSGGVISMLEGLQDKFVDERISLEKEEQKKRHTYEMLAQSLDAQLAQSKKEQQEKGQFKAKQLQSKASSEGDLDETKGEKKSDEKYSADLEATCSKKAAASLLSVRSSARRRSRPSRRPRASLQAVPWLAVQRSTCPASWPPGPPLWPSCAQSPGSLPRSAWRASCSSAPRP